jgi:hypothetical protein
MHQERRSTVALLRLLPLHLYPYALAVTVLNATIRMCPTGSLYLSSVEPELEFLSPWTPPHSPEALVMELQREVGPDHPLFAKATRALAVARDRDDVLFEIADGDPHRYAVVHLTWSGKREISRMFPSTDFFGSLEQWLEWMKADHEDYTHGEDSPSAMS